MFNRDSSSEAIAILHASYARVLGDVLVRDDWINRELVEVGFAWHYVRYGTDKRLAEAEKEAPEKKRGLRANRESVPHWEDRKNRRSVR